MAMTPSAVLISTLNEDIRKFDRLAQLIEELLPRVPDETARREWQRYSDECRARVKELRAILAAQPAKEAP